VEEVWAATLVATTGHRFEALQVLVSEHNTLLAGLAIQSDFAMSDELSGTSWMDADHRPPVAQVDGFAIVDRVTSADRPHPMIARNGELARCLRYGHTSRQSQGRVKKTDPVANMINISERSPEVEDRAVPGHWEGDLIIGARGASAVGTLVERTTRFL
jgi:hypothetical protein